MFIDDYTIECWISPVYSANYSFFPKEGAQYTLDKKMQYCIRRSGECFAHLVYAVDAWYLDYYPQTPPSDRIEKYYEGEISLQHVLDDLDLVLFR